MADGALLSQASVGTRRSCAGCQLSRHALRCARTTRLYTSCCLRPWESLLVYVQQTDARPSDTVSAWLLLSSITKRKHVLATWQPTSRHAVFHRSLHQEIYFFFSLYPLPWNNSESRFLLNAEWAHLQICVWPHQATLGLLLQSRGTVAFYTNKQMTPGVSGHPST